MHEVRPAKFMDIPEICALVLRVHPYTKYAEYPINMDRKMKPLLMESIRSGNGCAFVSLLEGKITGFIIGMVDDLYQVLNVKYATDLFFYVGPEDGHGASGLLDAFIAWARTVPKVVVIRLGITDIVSPDYMRVSKLYERKGLVRNGVLHEMGIAA